MASGKLFFYQNVLQHADLMLGVSQHDTQYLQKHFPGKEIHHLPSFHANDAVTILPGTGDYALYHGNIEVPENEHAATFLITKVFNGLDMPLIIAGMNPKSRFKKLADSHQNVMLVANPDDEKMFDLIRNAQVNILVTFQATGLKLKLLNTLYNGRYCLVNDAMTKGTCLESLCVTANTPEELRLRLAELFKMEFKEDDTIRRSEQLKVLYDNRENGRKIIDLIYKL
jgi:hypothetical protein